MFDFIDTYGFAIMVSHENNAPIATHLPLVLDRENEMLTGHFAKANRQWKGIEGQEVLVIFHGPHHYISSSWYETNQSVPTWNYIAVHVYGTVEIMTERDEILASLRQLVDKYEGPGSTYRIDASNEAFVQGLMDGIVAFRLKMNRIEGKWKLSQNHSRERQMRVIEALESIDTENAKSIAKQMRENLES
jgi:transcriptional regulator